MFKNILLAYDGSDCSNKALLCAANLAEQYGAELWLIHVFPHTSDLLGYEDFEKLFAKRKSAGQAVLDDALQRLDKSTFKIRTELLEGPEAESILQAAETSQADLIVIGTRGFGAVKGMLVGSVSRKVIHFAPCPVMVVH
jgi:nucleotide-binding universal stress UspA family protein